MSDKVNGLLTFGDVTISVKSIVGEVGQRLIVIENSPGSLAYLTDAASRFYLIPDTEDGGMSLVYKYTGEVVGECWSAEATSIELGTSSEYSNNLISALINNL